MPKPIVKFISEPPLELNCVDHKPVQIELTPRKKGDCTITLSVAAKSCNFETGEKTLDHLVDVQNDDDKITIDIPVKMITDEELKYFLLISAAAVNAEGEKSFTKRIEAEIDGRKQAEEPEEDEEPV